MRLSVIFKEIKLNSDNTLLDIEMIKAGAKYSIILVNIILIICGHLSVQFLISVNELNKI